MESSSYEVALGLLGQSKQPLIMAVAEEEKKANPSKAFIEYCNSRVTAIDVLRRQLTQDDADTVARILGKEDIFLTSWAAQKEGQIKFAMDVRFEVALELLGQSKQPLIMAIIEEEEKTNPSKSFIEYCKARKAAITVFQHQINPKDVDVIDRIFDKDPIFIIKNV